MRTLWAVAALLAAPVAAADNTLFFQGDTLDVEPVEEQESIPFGMRPVADAGEGSVMEWTYTFEAAGDFRPVQTTFWLEVTQPT
ncbi:MAG TPA: hypothetical protein VI796_07045, partial [Candidatus Thermoplasmatota archaeon]|nr:hypothetical protein [Candidatus Thermoplasmatota archaeon]